MELRKYLASNRCARDVEWDGAVQFKAEEGGGNAGVVQTEGMLTSTKRWRRFHIFEKQCIFVINL
jgi:hypothetical protein